MTKYQDLTNEEQKKELIYLEQEIQRINELELNLNISRGNPSTAQLDRISELFTDLPEGHISEEGLDCRNYGGLLGLIEMRRIFASMLRTSVDRIWCLGNSSLTIEYDLLTRLMLFALPGMDKPWGSDKVRFLCPVPGYDRHFAILELLGIDMIPVPMLEDGPDMDVVEELCAADERIKGMWMIPVYSNPDGTVYSYETYERLLRMEAAPDFRLFSDMAYCIHNHHEEKRPDFPDLLEMAKANGHPDRLFLFCSTSKITYAGAGVACIGMSDLNQEWLAPSLTTQMISGDKMNQLAHAKAIDRIGGVEKLMPIHRETLLSKFDTTLAILDEHLSPYEIASWKKPEGGYFICVKLLPGTAKAIVASCRELGLQLTAAGSVFPYGIDPDDRYLRLAPSFPEVAELRKAMKLFCIVTRYETLRKLTEMPRG